MTRAGTTSRSPARYADVNRSTHARWRASRARRRDDRTGVHHDHDRGRPNPFSIDTLTPRVAPRAGSTRENDPAVRAEPVWDPYRHTGSWRAVWAYSAKRAARDGKTLTAQEHKARAVGAGQKSARTPRFVKTTDGTPSLDEASPGPGRGHWSA